MTVQKLYAASYGAYIYNDDELLNDSDSDFPSMYRDASMTEGYHVLGGIRFLDTNQSNFLTVTWNENDTANRTLGLLVAGGNRTLTLYENFVVADGYDFTVQALGQANQLTLNENLTVADGSAITLTAEDAAGAIVLDNANFEVESTDASQRSFKITSAKAGDTTLTLEEDLTISDGYDVTIQALGQANQLTLNEGFTIGDGNAGTLTFSGASKTLTVEDNSVVNQDLTTDAGPTFASCNLGTGELTAGSINRASGTLTLEIGGVAQVSIATTGVTITPTLVLSTCIDAGADVDKFLVLDGSNNVDYRTGAEVLSDIGAALGEAGDAAGQMLFWDTSKWTHTETSELIWDDTNKRLGINASSPSTSFHIQHGGNSGTQPSWNAAIDIAIFEPDSSVNGAIQIFTANDKIGVLAFSDNDARNRGYISYYHSTDEMHIGAVGIEITVDGSSENVGIRQSSPTGQLHVNQSDASGAKPVLLLDQGDLSEEFIKLVGQSTTDASQSLVDAADMTTPGSIVGWFKIYVQDDQGTNPIPDGIYYVPFYDTPTS